MAIINTHKQQQKSWYHDNDQGL